MKKLVKNFVALHPRSWPIFFHVCVVAPPRYRLAGRETDAREDNTDGSLVDTHRRDRGENSDASGPEPASWWRAKRKKNFPSPIVTTVAASRRGSSREVSPELRPRQPSFSNFHKLSNFSLGRSLRLPGLRLYLGSTIFRPLILLLLLSGQCPNPGPLCPCGVCDSNVTWHGI